MRQNISPHTAETIFNKANTNNLFELTFCLQLSNGLFKNALQTAFIALNLGLQKDLIIWYVMVSYFHDSLHTMQKSKHVPPSCYPEKDSEYNIALKENHSLLFFELKSSYSQLKNLESM